MQQKENREPTIADVLDAIAKLEVRLDADIKATNDKVDRLDIKFDAFQKGTDGMVRMATTIIITAGTVTVLAPLAQAIAPAIQAFFGSKIG
jgi:hypothetical protein